MNKGPEKPLTVKKVVLWQNEVEDKPGILANALEPLANAGAKLQVVIGYRYPSDPGKTAIELYPVTSMKSVAAAKATRLTASSIAILLVEGDDRPGLGCAVARAIANAKIDFGFLVAQVIGKKCSATVGFETEAGARKAAAVIKQASAGKKK
jgi:hypothetical protein